MIDSRIHLLVYNVLGKNAPLESEGPTRYGTVLDAPEKSEHPGKGR